MKSLKIFGLALGVVALVAAAQPAQAACGAPFLITSLNQAAGYYAYVVNPSTESGGGLDGSTVTEDVTGFFWGLGVGNPLPGVGADNGTFPTLSWLYIYPNYPAAVLTTWAADPSISDAPRRRPAGSWPRAAGPRSPWSGERSGVSTGSESACR